MVKINLNSRVPFVQENGGLTKYGVDTLLSVFGEFPDITGLGDVTQAQLDVVDAKTDGSVTVHNDVSDAGSGQIITSAERSQLTGTVTAHSDVSNAGSGQIITTAERNTLGTALQPGTPPVITKSGNTLTLDDGEGGSSSVALITGELPFYLENGTLEALDLDVDGSIPFYLENGTQENLELT